MPKYQPVIGLEIHAELKTESKMFCDCLNDPDVNQANTHICPICTAQPGSLPVINKKAVESVIKTALALNCSIPDSAKFDRKNYFYPDLPKGYQISQYDLPLSNKGFLEINGKKIYGERSRTIRITRVHLEEDTGKLIHPSKAQYSLVDFNRAGVPLMELVTEPDIKSGDEAKQFCEELQLILRYLDVSEANMEKGQMRCEVNISLKSEKKELGTKVEIKNLNSFRSVKKAIDYEIKRQADCLDSNDKIIQETRGWDENKQKTFSQRIKEESQDYRYFPEPDLPPLTDLAKMNNQISKGIPEMPDQKRNRFLEQYKLPEKDIQVLISNKKLADYFEQVVSELETWLKIKGIEDKDRLIKLTANYLLTELQKLLSESKTRIENCHISPENFAEFISMIERKEISSSAAQTTLKEMCQTGADPSHIVESKGLKQVSNEGEIGKIAKEVIKENKKSVEDFRKGKENALQFLVGKVMAKSKGQANPEIARDILTELLKGVE